MSEIKSSGVKGYAFLAGVIAIFMFIVLVVYLYKYNGKFVPENPEKYSDLIQAAGRTFVA